MSKRAILFLFLIIVFVIFFVISFTIKSGNDDENVTPNNRTNEENIVEIIDENNIIEVSSLEQKTRPNTILILNKEYTDCGHTISTRASLPQEMVNLTKEEIIKQYPNWELQEFSNEQIVLSRTLESFCGEHYLLTEEDGHISIYTMDEQDNRTLKEATNISTEYLTETDKISLRNGLMVYGTENLNKLLEDFEG